jgi:endoglucanase
MRGHTGIALRHIVRLGLVVVTTLGLFGLHPSMAAVAAVPGFTSTTTVQPVSVAVGGSAAINVSVTASAASLALVDVEVRDPNGGLAYQQWFDSQAFAMGQTLMYRVTWNVPANAAVGTYGVKIGVFAPAWATLYQWNDSAAQVIVTRPAPPIFTTSATESPSSLAPGGTATIIASVTSSTSTAALVDIEIYGANGSRANQTFFDNQAFTAGQPRSFTGTWQVPTNAQTGNYVLDIGVFAPGWASTYAWNASAATLSVIAATATPIPSPTVTPRPATQTPTATPTPAPGVKDFGVNISGAEFGESHLPGIQGTDYLYPSDGWRMSYFGARGLKLVRIPFRWERVQPTAFGPLSAPDVAGLSATVNAAQAAGEKVILDMHNYGRYYNTPLTEADAAKFDDVWTKLAQVFASNPSVYGYELMNEPHDLPEGLAGWNILAQSATSAVRGVDGHSFVIVPGYEWQGAWTWNQWNSTLTVSDPANHVLYAAHQYFDSDGSGSYTNTYDAERAYPGIGVDRLQPFLSWLVAHNARGIVTEYGVPNSDSRWLTVLDNFVATLNSNSSIQGGTYWSAGPWWGSYPLSVEPVGGADAPQVAMLQKYPSRP